MKDIDIDNVIMRLGFLIHSINKRQIELQGKRGQKDKKEYGRLQLWYKTIDDISIYLNIQGEMYQTNWSDGK
jgi:hypothetical protein